MRIAVFQGPERAGGVADNLERMRSAAADASRRGARLLILPEMFLTGYDIGADAVERLAEPVDGPAFDAAAAIARATGVALLYGYPERAPDGVYNAAALVDRDGARLANHRKSHLFGDIDRRAFRAGGGAPALATLDGWRIGILICYDVEFPENVRALALAGADLVAVPTALMEPYAFVARSMVPTRAFENQLFVAYANRCGHEGAMTYCGESCVVAPDGADLARAGPQGEDLIAADLDRGRLADSRALNTYLRDRRPGLYTGLSRGGDAGEAR